MPKTTSTAPIIRSPLWSPWGQVDMARRLAYGVYRVSTSGHGGWMVYREVAVERLSPEAQGLAERAPDWYCYEEDCLWAVPALECPDTWTTAFGSQVTDPQACILKTLSGSNPEYLLARGITPLPEQYQWYLSWKEYERRRAAKDPDLIVAACGDWFTKMPGVDCVVTADRRSHLVTSASYETVHQFGAVLLLLSACEVVARNVKTTTTGLAVDQALEVAHA